MYKLIPETSVGGQGIFRESDERRENQKPLTLALSQRERGLNGGYLGYTST
jgi:hypothetical protein